MSNFDLIQSLEHIKSSLPGGYKALLEDPHLLNLLKVLNQNTLDTYGDLRIKTNVDVPFAQAPGDISFILFIGCLAIIKNIRESAVFEVLKQQNLKNAAAAAAALTKETDENGETEVKDPMGEIHPAENALTAIEMGLIEVFRVNVLHPSTKTPPAFGFNENLKVRSSRYMTIGSDTDVTNPLFTHCLCFLYSIVRIIPLEHVDNLSEVAIYNSEHNEIYPVAYESEKLLKATRDKSINFVSLGNSSKPRKPSIIKPIKRRQKQSKNTATTVEGDITALNQAAGQDANRNQALNKIDDLPLKYHGFFVNKIISTIVDENIYVNLHKSDNETLLQISQRGSLKELYRNVQREPDSQTASDITSILTNGNIITAMFKRIIYSKNFLCFRDLNFWTKELPESREIVGLNGFPSKGIQHRAVHSYLVSVFQVLKHLPVISPLFLNYSLWSNDESRMDRFDKFMSTLMEEGQFFHQCASESNFSVKFDSVVAGLKRAQVFYFFEVEKDPAIFLQFMLDQVLFKRLVDFHDNDMPYLVIKLSLANKTTINSDYIINHCSDSNMNTLANWEKSFPLLVCVIIPPVNYSTRQRRRAYGVATTINLTFNGLSVKFDLVATIKKLSTDEEQYVASIRSVEKKDTTEYNNLEGLPMERKEGDALYTRDLNSYILFYGNAKVVEQ